MNGVLHLVGHGLMQWDRASMTLHRALLLFSLQTFLTLSRLTLTHHHLLVMALLHFALSNVAIAHFLFAVFAVSSLSHLAVSIEVLRRVLAETVADGWHVRALRWWLVVVRVLRALRSLSEVGNRETVAARGLRVMLVVGG